MSQNTLQHMYSNY